MQNDLPQFEPVLECLENCGLVFPNFLLASSPGLPTLLRETFVSFFHHTCLGRSGEYQGRTEFRMRVKRLYRKQLMAFKTATSSRSFSILSSNSWWEMCSSGNRKRSVRRGGKYRSIRHAKVPEIQTGIFGRIERAQHQATFRSKISRIIA